METKTGITLSFRGNSLPKNCDMNYMTRFILVTINETGQVITLADYLRGVKVVELEKNEDS